MSASIPQTPPISRECPASPFQLGHRAALDGLRGIAILLVFLQHLEVPFLKGGFIGVDLFFVLSGFLITSLLCEEWNATGGIDFWGFYRRRALRLLPAFVLLLLFLLGYVLVKPPPPVGMRIHCKALLVAALYLMNWFSAFGAIEPSYVTHTWSLSCEEQYYLAWPLLLFAMLRMGWSRALVLTVALLMITACASFRAIHWHLHHDALRLYFSIDTHSDGLLLGSVLGLVASWNLLPQRRRSLSVLRPASWICAIAVGCIAWRGGLDGNFYWFGGLVILNLAVVVVILSTICFPSGVLSRALSFAPLRWMGRVSYGIYLWHYVFCKYFLKNGTTPLRVVAVLAATFAVATLSFYLLEKPLLRFKRRGVQA